jgi:hypothetical protein
MNLPAGNLADLEKLLKKQPKDEVEKHHKHTIIVPWIDIFRYTLAIILVVTKLEWVGVGLEHVSWWIVFAPVYALEVITIAVYICVTIFTVISMIVALIAGLIKGMVNGIALRRKAKRLQKESQKPS